MSAYDPTETYRKRSFRNIPHQVRLKKIDRLLTKAVKDRKVSDFIDIGCASGFITQRIKKLLNIESVVGTDALEEYIVAAKKSYPGISFTIMDLNQSITSPRRYDLVTCFETLEHVGNLETAIDNIYQSISQNGIAVISVPIEVGVIGTIKYLLKVKVFGDKFNEIGPAHQKSYFKSLLKGEDISKYRQVQKELWWDHFGFNYKTIEKYLTRSGIKFEASTFFTTRFVTIFK